VEVSYKSKKLEKQLLNPRKMIKTFGSKAKKINQRLKDLSSAHTS
jgi:proteic killer suppression protein